MMLLSAFLRITMLACVPQLTWTVGVSPAVLASEAVRDPIESQLALGSSGVVLAVHRTVHRFVRLLSWSAKRWATWTSTLLLLVAFLCVAPVVGSEPLRTWRGCGFAAFCASVGLALAVYVRLIADPRAPLLGKALLLGSVIYGVVPQDVVPDSVIPSGFIDDFAAVWLASRCFMRLCPQRLVEKHAAHVSRAHQRNLQRRAARHRESQLARTRTS